MISYRTHHGRASDLSHSESCLDVGITALTQFHLFGLASHLASQGMLGSLYTGYPRFRLPRPLQARAVTRSIPLVLTALARVLSGTSSVRSTLNRSAATYFDWEVARCLRPHDVLVGLSGQSLRSFRRGVQLGCKTVCERGSTHILFQDLILKEEHYLWGIPYSSIHRRTIDQELEEYELCDRIAVPSAFTQQTFLDRGVPKRKLIRNPYGIALDEFQPQPKRDRIFRILFVGELSVRKGIGYLLRALELLRGFRCETWLIGPAVQAEMLTLVRRAHGSVQYRGRVSRHLLSNYYSQASVLVLPSVEEGMALVQAQAMACGIPIIATTNTGATDLFEDGKEGFIVPIRSPQHIADRIIRLADSQELQESMRANCLKRVQTMGGWTGYGQRAITHYHELVSSSCAV